MTHTTRLVALSLAGTVLLISTGRLQAATLQSIAVTPANPSIAKGLTQQFTATGTFSDNTMQDLTNQVTWASGMASVATITSSGLATAVGTGTSTISASMSGVTGSTVLTVTAAVLQSIAVTPANPSIAKGLTQQFTATGTYSDNSTQDLTNQVTWASGMSSVATISSSGLATAVAMGTSTISASLSGVTGSTVLTVTAAVLQSIAVTPANPLLPEALTQQFTATGTYSDSSTQDLTNQVTWASATTSVATINSSGLATAVAMGTSTISATLGAITGSTVLTVTSATLQSIAVTPANPSIAKGLTQQFTATGTFSDNSTQDLTNQVTWASATTSVATIDSSGLATAVSTGTSTISASLGGVTGSTVLTVTAAVLQSIAVTPANPSIGQGLTQQFTATGTFSDSSTQDLTNQVTWASGTPSAASINSSGLATGVAPGMSIIGATLGGVMGSTVLTVVTTGTASVTPTNTLMATPTITPAPGAPVITGGVETGSSRVNGTGAPRPTPNTCIEICLAAVPSMPSTPPCTGADTLLGIGGTNASGTFIDTGGVPGIPLASPLGAGECVYAFDQCAMERGTVSCARLPAPAPVLSSWGWLAAAAALLWSAFTALGRHPRRR